MEGGRRKASSKTAKILIIAGLVLVSALSIWVVGRPAWELSRARHDVAELQFALEGYLKLYGSLPAGTPAEVASVLLGKDMRGQMPEYAPIMEASGYELNAAGEFIDPWNVPYRIEVTPITVRVYSCGPNRLDESGRGDDIVPGL